MAPRLKYRLSVPDGCAVATPFHFEEIFATNIFATTQAFLLILRWLNEVFVSKIAGRPHCQAKTVRAAMPFVTGYQKL